ncbi:MAG: phosphoheptose isomerase, partial [Clostridia bacterium]|nr:phosphoheptose isomerase [Clostridia bacterium]
MSFMFHPYPYLDPNAVNPVAPPPSVQKGLRVGPKAVALAIAEAVKGGKRRVGIDCYPGAEIGALRAALQQYLPEATVIDAASLAMEEKALDEKLLPYLPMDRDRDPVLLYGRRFEEGYAGLQDAKKVEALSKRLREDEGAVIVAGMGALSESLRTLYDHRIWMDLSPRQAALNYKNGLAKNYGSSAAKPYALMMRRNYYVDFETALNTRWSLIRKGALDAYIFADSPESMRLLPYGALLELFDELIKSPLRARPVYLEGVWGGFYVHRKRKLPKEMRNCAWVFDLIPMEVTLAADFAGGGF